MEETGGERSDRAGREWACFPCPVGGYDERKSSRDVGEGRRLWMGSWAGNEAQK